MGGESFLLTALSSPSMTNNIISDTPEPSTLLLLGSGLFGVAGVVRRKINL